MDLQLGPQAQPPQGASANPLGMLHDLTGIQQTLAVTQNQRNQARQFQQEWAARQRAGSIIAGAPDWQTAAKSLSADPLVSGWLPEMATHMLNNQNINQQLQGQMQQQSQTGLEGLYKGLAMAANDPTKFDQAMKLGLGSIPPNVQQWMKANGDPLGTIQSVLGPLAKSDPQGLQKTIAALQLTTVSPQQVFAQTGRVAPTLQQAPAGGGALVRGGFSDTPGSPQLGTSPGATPPSPTGGATAQKPPAASPAASPTSFDGTPLYAPSSMYPTTRRDAQGLPIREEQEQGLINEQAKNFVAAQPVYNAAANSIGTLESVKADIQQLAKSGGWMTPGAGGTARAQIGNAINTLYTSMGKEPPVDITSMAAGQNFIKNTGNLGFSLVESLGGGHQALGTLQQAISSVPSIENSPLGGMLVADSLQASARWLTEQAQFKQKWAQDNAGNLSGADEAFRQLHPPVQFVKQVLGKYGLGENGFSNEADVKKAYDSRLISRDMAAKILKDQFKFQP